MWPCSSCRWLWPAWPGRPSPTGVAAWSTPWWRSSWGSSSSSSVLSLAAGALAGGTGSVSGGPGGGNAGAGFTDVLAGAALLLLSAFAPWALFRLLPFLEAGAIGHLEGMGRHAGQSAAAPVKSLAHVALGPVPGVGSAAVAVAAGVGGALKGAKGAASGALDAGSPEGSRAGDPGGARGGGPGGSLPEAVPSSAETTGVGTTQSPGHDIPAWSVNPGGTEEWNRSITEHPGAPISAEPLPPTVSSPLSVSPPQSPPPRASGSSGQPNADASVAALTPLPRATGSLHPGALGRDQLGVKLIDTHPAGPGRHPSGAAPPATPRSPAPTPPPPRMAEMPERIRPDRVHYRFSPLERRGVIAGWRGGQIASVAASLVLAVVFLRSRPTVGGIVLALAGVGVGVAVAFWPVFGRTGEQWLPLVVRWAWAGSSGSRRQLASAPPPVTGPPWIWRDRTPRRPRWCPPPPPADARAEAAALSTDCR